MEKKMKTENLKSKENQVLDGDQWFEDTMKAEAARTSKPEKAPKKSKEKAEKPEPIKDVKIKNPGVIASILEFIEQKGPITQAQILDMLVKRFPDRAPEQINATIKAQIGGRKRPVRMEREKGITLKITEDDGIRGFQTKNS